MKLFTIVTLLLLSFFRINDYSLYANIVLSCFLIKEVRDGNMPKFNKIDYCVVLIWGYELLSLFATINHFKSFQYFKLFTSSVLFYFSLRLFFKYNKNIRRFLFTYSIFIAIASIIGIYTFYLLEERLTEIGFREIYQFRHLYKPLGAYNNAWGSIQILFMGTCLLATIYCRKNKLKLVICFMAFTISLCGGIYVFSRGVYLAIFVGLVWWCISVFRNKTSFPFLMVGLVVLSVSSISQREAVSTAIEFNQNTSQQRSISGRIDVIKTTEKLFKMHPVLGGGSGNFSLLFNNYRYEDSNVQFTSYSPNIVVQLITEKGIIGTCLFIFLFCLLLLYFIRYNKNPIVYLIMGILVIYIVREQTFSIFLESLSVQWTLFLLLAISQTFNRRGYFSLRKNERFVLTISIIGLCVGITIFSLMLYRNTFHNKMFLSAIKNGDVENAVNHLEKTSQTTPYLINRALFKFSLYKEKNDYESLIQAKEYITKATLLSPYDNQLKYYQAVINSHMGETETSMSFFEQIVIDYPNNALYQFGYSELLYRLGNKEKAAIHLCNSILLVPRMLNTVEWNRYVSTDNTFVTDVMQKLKDRIKQCEENDPIKLARYGSIAIHLKEIPLAKRYIEKSLELLPNLVYPWYNLSIIEKQQGNLEQARLCKERFIVLAAGAFIPENIKQRYDNTLIENLSKDISFLFTPYYAKYREWYNAEPYNCHIY